MSHLFSNQLTAHLSQKKTKKHKNKLSSFQQNGYGLSEISALAFLGKEGDSVDCMAHTVGSVTEHVEVRHESHARWIAVDRRS